MYSELYIECIERARKHTSLFHYTNLSALEEILSSKSIQLSELSAVDDLEEGDRVADIIKEKVFVACFTHIPVESIPLWNMYSGKIAGVRLEISDIQFLENVINYNIEDNKFGIRDCHIMDIEYVENTYDYYLEYDPLNTGNLHKDYNNIGLIKSKQWDFQCETRVRLYVDVVQGVYSNSFHNGHWCIIRPNFTHVYCKIPESVLQKLKITFSPYTTEDTKKEIVNIVNLLLPQYDANNFQNSILEGKVKKQ